MPSTITLHDISSPYLPAPVSYAVLSPSLEEPVPLCILLLGAGGTCDSLFDLQELFDTCWAEGSVPHMMIVTPTPGLDYYLEEPAGRIRWDSFLATDFVPHLRSAYNLSDAGVAAMQPMLEPGLSESKVGPRNRLHHSSGGPPQLIGPVRDPLLWESNNPANLARANAQPIRAAGGGEQRERSLRAAQIRCAHRR